MNQKFAPAVESGFIVDVEKREVAFASGARVHLARQPVTVLAALVEKSPKVASRAHLWQALYWNAGEAGERDPKILDVIVCKLRRVLRPHGVEITTVWGSGYYIGAPRPTPKSAAQTGGR